MKCRFYLMLGVLVAGTFLLGAAVNKPAERSPHASALELVFRDGADKIRTVEKDNWWHDVEKREWIVQRPFAPGFYDSTHLFNVTYKIDGKEVAKWFVDTKHGKVELVNQLINPGANK